MTSHADWSAAPTPEGARRLEDEGYPAWLAALLARRDVATAAEAEAFLDPRVAQLHPPAALAGLPQAVERLAAAREAGERVALVGDYDVDGVSATALLAAVLGACGIDCETILPHRLREGYGLQPVHVERAAAAGCAVMVTADCGSSSHEAATAAAERGVDLIVTDHHLPSRPLPATALEINPKRELCDYPFPDLCGAGLALKLAMAVAERCAKPVPTEALLRVACLGTICDMVPLRGENRVIAALGLRALPQTPSPGLQALIRRCRLREPFTADDVGFRLGPRINAAGRMDSPDPALELLLTRDREAGEALAARLEEHNARRVVAESQAVEEAEALFAEADPLPPLLVAWRPGWHRGVLGIAAGRLARRFHRPALLLTVDNGQATGSGRSVPGIHLHAFLEGWREAFETFGGHAQAVGLSVASDRLEELRQAWLAEAAAWDPEALRRRLEYELDLTAGRVDVELVRQLERLAPFGVGNRRPLARVARLRLAGPSRRFGNGHIALGAEGEDGARLDLVGWRWAERVGELEGWFEAIGPLSIDRFHGRPVLRLVDARPVGSPAGA